MWARTSDAGNGRFSPLTSAAAPAAEGMVPCLASSTISAMLMTHDRDTSVDGQWYSDTSHLFNLSLTERPPSARGYFENMGEGYRPVGDLFFLPKGQRYLARGGPGRHKTLFVEMQSDALSADVLADDGLDLGNSDGQLLHACMNLRFDRLRGLLMQIGQEVQAPGFASALMLEGLGISLLAETLRVLERTRQSATRKGGLAPWRLRMIEARVRDGEGAPSLAELADVCGLSRRQLMRAFREETGQTVGAFVHNLALDRARNLLDTTDLPVGQVAACVGFSSSGAFSTAFRRATGDSPRSFRLKRRRA